MGWFTASEGGEQVTEDTFVTEVSDHILYAHWEYNNYKIYFDANGGNVSIDYKVVTYNEYIGELPTPTRDYYNFVGWYESHGDKVTSNMIYGMQGNLTVTAKWELKPVSDWVKAENVPVGAKVTSTKWTYTETEVKESTSSYMEGATMISSYWKESNSGSNYYSTAFPSAFKPNDASQANNESKDIYSSYMRSPYEAYEYEDTKRVVTNTREGWVYWHWMYNSAYNGEYNRVVSATQNSSGYNGYAYVYFFAIASTVDCPAINDYSGVSGYAGGSAPQTWDCRSILKGYLTTKPLGLGTARMFRFEYYKSTYTDYIKMYKHRIETQCESYSEVVNGGSVSNAQKWVQYREK